MGRFRIARDDHDAGAGIFPLDHRRGLEAVAQAGSTTVPDMRRVFSNVFLDKVFFDVFV